MDKTREEEEQILQELENVQFLSPNEPITHWGIERIINWLREKTDELSAQVGSVTGKTITMWDPNITYHIGDIVLHFKQENK